MEAVHERLRFLPEATRRVVSAIPFTVVRESPAGSNRWRRSPRAHLLEPRSDHRVLYDDNWDASYAHRTESRRANFDPHLSRHGWRQPTRIFRFSGTRTHAHRSRRRQHASCGASHAAGSLWRASWSLERSRGRALATRLE